MIGLKENVIIGKLIPAGTGMKRYRNVKLDTSLEDVMNEEYSDAAYEAETEAVGAEETASEE